MGISRWVLAIVALTQFAPISTADAQSEHKQVFVLHSTRRDAQVSLVAESELPRTLDAGLAQNLDYYAEFIDVTRFPDSTYTEGFRDFLRLKYQGVRFDLVIALQDPAIEFLTTYGDGLFRDAPIVFLTNNPARSRRPNSTGFFHERDFAATPAFIRQLQPDVRTVFIVTGAAGADKQYENEVRRQLQPDDSGVTFTYLSGLATPDLEDRLSKLPEDSAVYYVLVTEDGAGLKFHPLEYVNRVAAAASAPTYSWVDSTMDRGIVGGSLYSQKGAIEQVGQLAVRVLRGEAADSIPIGVLDLNAKQVDWRQLRRWGIAEARIPPGTLVWFREPTIWDQYRIYILAALAVVSIQTALITTLLIQRNRRQRAENELRRSQGELLKSAERNRDLGARLLSAQETERARIARELHDDICQRMLLLTFELESLGRTNPGEPATEALRVAKDVSKSLHELSHQLHPTRLRLIGLVAAVDRLCHELSRGGIAITYTHKNVPSTVPPDVMLCLFRVVQEALQNALKHSNAGELSVHLSGNGGGGLTLTIADNGAGFDVDAAWKKGIGLVSMVERLDTIGASLEIRSSPGGGTRLTATIPPAFVRGTHATPPEASSDPRAPAPVG